MKEEIKYKVGDRVYSPRFGDGIITNIADYSKPQYPIEVHWTGAALKSLPEYDYFTPEGQFTSGYADPKYDITSKDVHDKSLDKNGINNGRRKIMDYQKIAREIVLNYVNEHLDKTDNVDNVITLDDVYLVWFCKTLQNWKALVSTDLPDGMYYEVTYNGDKKEVYLDTYKKFDNLNLNSKVGEQ